ncbi:MAG TPA: site-2 protease family protein [Gemmatimonadales bacterium]|nr:site-2 protease family protein [Gemmatimonadales bacterium]
MPLTEFLIAWRTTALHDREVVDALVHPAHAAPSPGLRAALAGFRGRFYWSNEPDGRHLVLTRPFPRRPERWALHVALFLATLATTTFAGGVLVGTIPYDNPLDLLSGTYPLPHPLLPAWAAGLAFSLPLLAVLLCHELGHYVTARWYALDVSPPYFIPVPLVPSFIGTMGAFIRLRTLLADRRQLFDVGAAGPLAGFAVALPLLWIGLARSHPLPGHGEFGGMLVAIGGDTIGLGDSLVTLVVRRLALGPTGAVLIGPLAFAGWVGMLVTMLNLLPISQLDGGHVLYAALPRWHGRIAFAFWVAIIALGWWWRGWLVWGVIVLALSRGRLTHPPVLDAVRPLPSSRRWSAIATLVLFGVTFAPVPFRL